MLTRAKIAADIAALAEEVNQVARRRGRALPTPEDLGDLLRALGVTREEAQAAREPGEGQEERLAALFTPGEVAPAAEALKQAYLTVVVTAVRQDRPAYHRALRGLRPVLADLLVRRAGQWSARWAEASRCFELYRGASSWLAGVSAPPPLSARPGQTSETWAAESVAKAKGWQLALLAGLALNVAQTELREWRDWITGGAAKQHGFLLRERSNPDPCSSEEPAAWWARDVAKHALSEEEEAELVRRGVVSAEALAAVKALPPIPAGRE